VDGVGHVVRAEPFGVGGLHLPAQLRPRVAARLRPFGVCREAGQVAVKGAASCRGETPVGPPDPRQRAHEVAAASHRLKLAARMALAQPHNDAISERDLLRLAARSLHADRAHRLLGRETTRLVESGESAGGHGVHSAQPNVTRGSRPVTDQCRRTPIGVTPQRPLTPPTRPSAHTRRTGRRRPSADPFLADLRRAGSAEPPRVRLGPGGG